MNVSTHTRHTNMVMLLHLFIVVDFISQLGSQQALMYKSYNIGGQQKNKTNIETKQK